MNIQNIQDNVSQLIKNLDEESFVYDLLLAYNLPKSTITRLEKGTANLSKTVGEVNLKRKLFFKKVDKEDLHLTLSRINDELKHDNRFIVVTDFKTFLAKDIKVNITLDIHIKDLPKNFDFFLPWAGLEKSQYHNENPADIKAAMKMGKLFEQIKTDNNDDSPEFLKRLNIFLSRLLFCFFAEDSDIFEENIFSNRVGSLTSDDGSDLKEFFIKLFNVLNTRENERINMPNYLDSFPYVNGGLFKEKLEPPNFSKSSRKIIIESGTLSWKDINPDIFGSMFQAVNHANERGTLGQHFTSVSNILKVINPLFMDDLKDDFEKAKGNNKKLKQLLFRLKNIKIFDPACGSGNFLIIAYKELRRLEMEIFKEMGTLALSEITLSQFYGIEIDEFAKEIAILALWLTKHQMNVEFYREFGRTNPTLPLTDAGNIVQDNACRVDWEKVCPKNEDDEIYILGNPPYVGSKKQNKQQKKDIKNIFSGLKGYKNLDYISCWFFKGVQFNLKTNSKTAFVSTNSISQGDQVGLLWEYLLKFKIEIGFAHQSFKWENNAKGSAGVTCVIIGLRNPSNSPKYIYSSFKKSVQNISPYLIDAPKLIVNKRNVLLSDLSEMVYGNMPLDGGYLKLDEHEKEELISMYPTTERLIRPLIGGAEFLRSINRYCLWIEDDNLSFAKSIKLIDRRIEGVMEFRKNGGDVARTLVDKSHQFRYRKVAKKSFLVIPCTTSERREYMQCGFFDSNYISMNSLQVIYDSELYIFSVLSSKAHMIWIKTVAGRLKEDYRYSTQLCYNTFPFPNISKQRKGELTQCSLKIIDERLKHSEKTMAELYDPDKMPEGLREAHRQNDLAVERCYRSNLFNSDEERLQYLFNLYKKMIEEEKFQNTLFAKEKKTRKRKTT